MHRGKRNMNDIEITNIPNISKRKAKKLIMDYFKKHKTAYVSELVEKMHLDLGLVIDILNELEKEGKLKENPTVL